MDVTADVTEGLGTEIHAIFTIDAPPVEHASITSAADRGDEEDETFALAGGKSLWTARVSSRSAVRPGAPLQLAVDTSRPHFFDPVIGESIRHPLSAGAGGTVSLAFLSRGQGHQPPVITGARRISAPGSWGYLTP